jgi:hypothetical protein
MQVSTNKSLTMESTHIKNKQNNTLSTTKNSNIVQGETHNKSLESN